MEVAGHICLYEKFEERIPIKVPITLPSLVKRRFSGRIAAHPEIAQE